MLCKLYHTSGGHGEYPQRRALPPGTVARAASSLGRTGLEKSWRNSYPPTICFACSSPYAVVQEGSRPNYDLGILITVDIGLALMTILGMMLGFWAMLHEMREISAISERVAGIAERLDARLRRQ